MTTFVIKVIAIICMLLSHIAAVFRTHATYELFNLLVLFSWIGGIAFPIFAYLIAQGCKHTKNMSKYLLRLGIFALVSEIPFDLAFSRYMTDEGIMRFNISFLANTNVFYTLFLGVACIAIYEKLKKKKRQWAALFAILLFPLIILMNFTPFADYGLIISRIVSAIGVVSVFCITHFLPDACETSEMTISRKIIPIISVLPMLFMASMFQTDYAAFGVGLIFILYLSNPENKVSQISVLIAGIVYHYGIHIFSEQAQLVDGIVVLTGSYVLNRHELYAFLFALMSVVIIFLYNGKQGPKFKWAFYVFYPAHLAVLAAIWWLIFIVV